MLIGEALNKGMKYQKMLREGKDLSVDQEELRQFMDVAVVAIARMKATSNLVSEEFYKELP